MLIAPQTVFVGIPFTIEYAMNVSAPIYISFWADLLPSQDHMIAQGLRLLHYSSPAIGEFDENAEPVINRGGRGCWRFDQPIQPGTYNLKFTLVAQKPGMKSFTTLLATNPPSYITMMAIGAIDEAPVAQNDYAQGYDNQPIHISVLDNDHGYSALLIKEVGQPAHGMVTINADHSVTYTSDAQFEGVDNFIYTVQDIAGNTAQGKVEVKVTKMPVAHIIS